MKKFLSVLLLIAMAINFTACTSSNEENDSWIHKGWFSVSITYPASIFKDDADEDIAEYAEKYDCKDYSVNDDGSVTFKMSKSHYKDLLQDSRTQIDETISDFLDGDNKISRFQSITYNDDFSEINIYIDYSADIGLGDMINEYIAISTLYLYSTLYQNLSGIPNDDVQANIFMIDSETNEIVDSYPGEDTDDTESTSDSSDDEDSANSKNTSDPSTDESAN